MAIITILPFWKLLKELLLNGHTWGYKTEKKKRSVKKYKTYPMHSLFGWSTAAGGRRGVYVLEYDD